MRSVDPVRPFRGFTLIELLVVLVIIAALAGIAYPIIRSGVNSSRKAACLSNLKQIGTGLEAYLQDNHQRMPELEAGRASKNEDLPVLETVLIEYLETPDVFHCPADSKEFKASGCSYLWNPTQSGLHVTKLEFFGTDDASRIPLVIDKEAWHGGETTGSNFLYADQSAENRVRFSTSP
ncbi:hypothetical protein HAHE_17820 [Haloferula helveola]|uniref:Prepilin-type N-terminal cleavage/methylation domain-containing protein n=1 Tax=Haloferula helveola TaxID=490095 RepID=A0ABM7RDE3_9BACT|nr:hypothetical protein HAHE_17820 [Haloferula helveola]